MHYLLANVAWNYIKANRTFSLLALAPMGSGYLISFELFYNMSFERGYNSKAKMPLYRINAVKTSLRALTAHTPEGMHKLLVDSLIEK